MEAFATMSSEDLLDIGIEDAEHRLKLLNLILKLNRQQVRGVVSLLLSLAAPPPYDTYLPCLQTAEAADDRLVYQESTASRTNGASPALDTSLSHACHMHVT